MAEAGGAGAAAAQDDGQGGGGQGDGDQGAGGGTRLTEAGGGKVGFQAPEWYGASLGEETRTALAAANKAYDSPDAMAGALLAAEKKIGQKGVLLPGADAKPEDWDPVWNALGRPETPEGYAEHLKDFQRPEGWNPEQEAAFLKDAHAEGYTPGMARFALEQHVKWFTAAQEAAAAAQAAERKAWDTELRQAFGAEYDAAVNEGRVAIKAVAEAALGDDADAFKQWLDDTGAGDHPAMARVARFLFQQLEIGEDGVLAGGSGGGGGAVPSDPKAARAEINRVLDAADTDPANHPYYNAKHADHRKTHERLNKLYAAEAAGKAAAANKAADGG